MPKPTDEYTWNDNETNEAVPTGGHASDGYAASEIPASNEWNRMFRINGEVSRWVGDGSAAPDEDAHIVETDATGQANVALAVFGPPTTTPDNATVVVYGPQDGGHGILAYGSELGGAGISAEGGDSQPGGFFTGGSNGGFGVYAQGQDTGAGVVGYGGEAGSGGEFNCGNNGASGLTANGQNGAPGVIGNGVDTGDGVEGNGGSAGGYGVHGTAGQADSYGVRGVSHSSGSATGNGVRGQGFADSVGVRGDADSGYGVVASSRALAPTRSALRIVPQNSEPSSLSDGDVWMNGGTNEMRVRLNGVSRSAWSTASGIAHGIEAQASATNNNSAAYTTIATASMASPYQPTRTGVVRIMASAEFGADGGTLHTQIDVRVYDNTASAVVWQRTIDHPASAASVYDRPWSIELSYTLPASGARDFLLQFRRLGAGGTGISARDASISALGVF